MPSSLESPESSSPIITRAVAAGLQNEFSDPYIFTPWQRRALQFLGHLPQGGGRAVISRFEALSGLDPARLAGFKIDTLVRERLDDYTKTRQSFPCMTFGAALGGASAHLALALGGPFLPQAFVVTLKGGAFDGNVQTYYRRSAELAREIAGNNPGLLTVQHYDPVHDAWMTRRVNHLRFKLLDLPPAYAAFIRAHLDPGGAVCYLDCGARWLRYRVGERSVFQVGGWGDLSPQEYLEGSERLQRYCQAAGLRHGDWRLEGFPLEEGPESEWGSEPGLGSALEDFCRGEGYRFVRIALPEPHDFSRLAYRAAAYQLERQGRTPAGVLVEMFSQFDATAVQRSDLLPLWLVFNTWDSLAFLKSMRPEFPSQMPVFFSPLATFTITPDLVPWQDWEAALGGLEWTNAGARPSHYPADALALTSWSEPLRAWAAQHPAPPRLPLDVETLSGLEFC